MSDINHAGSDLIFELEDRPPFHQALVGAITHLLAIFVPMVTPALIVGAALQLSAETTAYLVSMAMIASGIGTWLQVNRYGIVGSGLLSIQSVNFSFVTVMIALGSSMKSDGFHEELIMSSLLGVSFVGAFLVVGSSFILPYLRRVITPTVSGIVVLMIGLSLIKVGIIDFGGGVVGTIYLLSVLEAVGDITATAMVSRRPIQGEEYQSRLKGGVLADGLVSVIASAVGSLPLTTFAQNNGVIQMTGVASRYVGRTIAVMLVILGLFPMIGGFFTTIPSAVLGGAMTLMFSMIAIAGIRIIITNGLKRRETLIVATSLGLGLGISYDPEIFKILPASIYVLVENPICAGGLTAILLNIILPGGYRQENVLPGITSAEEMD